jgi:gamma-glutamyltranspeptidase/glutathione hydrolase
MNIGGGDRVTGLPFATRSPVIARHGAVATAHPLASHVAIDILKAGGSAVDAAVAVNAALGLMEPVNCGIGGDLFALVWDPRSARLHGYNGSGRSPMGRSLATLRRRLAGQTRIPSMGSLAVTVPGAVDAWFALHGRFGKLPMSAVLGPAIVYAREGVPVPQYIAHLWGGNLAAFEAGRHLIEETDNLRATYRPDGRLPSEGEIFCNPGLADTYASIAEGGREAFYTGAIARTIDAYFQRIGGDLRDDDFAAHTGEWVDPAHVRYRGYDVYELPPNTQGLAALQMLNVVEGYDLAAMGAGSADALHVMVEAKRLAFEDAARYYADPAFAEIPIEWLLSKAYAAERRAGIRLTATMARVAPGVAPTNPDTTCFSVADDDGMMVSLIQSNFRGMGSGLVPDGLGFMFQNRGELFSLTDGHPNIYAPGKRPFQTIIPGFVLKDGRPWLSFGVMGGDMQPQGHVQVLVNLIDFGMNVQEAGDAARFRHGQGHFAAGAEHPAYGELQLENGIPRATREELVRRGHHVTDGRGGFGGYQAILRDDANGVYRAASESRKDGCAIGY